MNLLDDLTGDSIIKVGEKAPNFILDTENGEKWQLSGQLGNVVALLFYPQNETLVCTKQLCSVRDRWADYLETKASIVGISSGTRDENLRFSRNYGLPLPVLADNSREITKIYSQHWLFPIQFMRGIVVIDAKGIIRHRKIMLRAFRPTDKSVLASIYAARTESLQEDFSKILNESKEKNKLIEY